DLDTMRLLACFPQIAAELHPQPGLGRTPARLLEPDRHLWGHAAMTIQEIGKGLAGHAKRVCRGGHGETKGLETILSDDLARMCRIMHRHSSPTDISYRRRFDSENAHRGLATRTLRLTALSGNPRGQHQPPLPPRS